MLAFELVSVAPNDEVYSRLRYAIYFRLHTQLPALHFRGSVGLSYGAQLMFVYPSLRQSSAYLALLRSPSFKIRRAQEVSTLRTCCYGVLVVEYQCLHGLICQPVVFDAFIGIVGVVASDG